MTKRSFMRLFRLLFVLAFLLPLVFPAPVKAQTNILYYIVRDGETLTTVADYFHTTAARLALANSITNYDMVIPGTKIFIPGFSDLSGTLVPHQTGLGDTAESVMRQSRMDESVFNRINFLTSADAVTVGQTLFTLEGDTPAQKRVPIPSGMTDLELAALQGVNRWTAAEYNNLSAPWRLIANDTLYLPASDPADGGEILPGVTSLSATALKTGKVAVFNAAGTQSASLGGELIDYPLHFFAGDDGSLTALQGVPRMIDNKPVDLSQRVPVRVALTTTDAEGNTFTLQQTMTVQKLNYGYDEPIIVDEEYVDPATTESEMNFVLSIVAEATPEKLWNGAFIYPVDNPDYVSSTYGRLRSLDFSGYKYFHTGTDYYGEEGVPIYAAEDGVVVYTGELTIRGVATIINHGHGVYTGYWHQSVSEVSTGQQVSAGQEIGLIGSTGRATGPHLHFEVLVGSVQVDPDDWINGLYP